MDLKIDNIIVHCSASKYGDVEVIRDWHVNCRKWRDIGYHFVLCNGFRNSGSKYRIQDDGIIEPGRELNKNGIIEQWEIGAHALGYNDRSVGICFVGNDYRFTARQITYGFIFLDILSRYFQIPIENILGHRETGVNKTCPMMEGHLIRNMLGVLRTSPIIAGLSDLDPWQYVEQLNGVLQKT